MNEDYIKKIYEKKENEKLLYDYLKEKPKLKNKKIKPLIANGIQVYLEYDDSDDSDNEKITKNKQSIINTNNKK